MSKLVVDFVSFISPFSHDKKEVKTSSFVFKLITKHTLVILLSAFLCNVFFGSVGIECFPHGAQSHLRSRMELKCWMDGVFLDKSLLQSEIGKKVVREGLGEIKPESNYISFKFYQWIYPMIMMQSFVFFVPRVLWRINEKGIMQKLLEKTFTPIFTDDWEKQRKNLIAYLVNIKKKYHREYALKYLFCEIMAILSIIINMFITKWIIRDFWTDYSPAVASFFRGDFDLFNRQASILFPIQARCEYSEFGPSGTLSKYDSLCILPQNIYLNKVFVFLYVWYIFILICSIINLIYMLVMYLFNVVRIYSIGHMLERTTTIRECKELSSNGNLGIWFTLNAFNRNLLPTHFQDVCKELRLALKNNEVNIGNKEVDYEDIEKY